MSGVSLTLAAVTGGLAVLHIVIHDADSLAEYLNVGTPTKPRSTRSKQTGKPASTETSVGRGAQRPGYVGRPFA